MLKDLCYKAGGPTKTLLLSPQQGMPEALKRAITLMVFSQDPEIRNFDGASIVTAFPRINTGGFTAIVFNLTKAAKRIRDILKETNPEVTDVYFNSEGTGSSISITLNVTTSTSTQSAVVYI